LVVVTNLTPDPSGLRRGSSDVTRTELSRTVNPSNSAFLITVMIRMFEGERTLERGQSPLSLLLPSPAIKACFIYSGSGWRGVRGEAKKTNQMYTEPEY
jgi:hypothetical protein